MHIGVVTTSYPRTPGEPAGCFVSELNDWVRAQGHELTVLAAGDSNDDDSWQPVPVHRVAARPGLFYQGGAPDALAAKGATAAAASFSVRMALEVRRRLQHCDGLIAHWLVPSAIAAVLAQGRRPIWAIAHGGDVHLLKRLGLSAALARLVDRPQLHLNFVSRALRDHFADAAGARAQPLLERSGVCSMGIDVARLHKARSESEARASGAPPHLVFLGRLVAIKGVDLLLEALAGQSASYTLSIAGAGPELGALQTQARELGIVANWLGEVRGEDRDRLLASADLVVMPSRRSGGREEGMPLVALEALAAGAQLLCARSGGLSEIPGSICMSFRDGDVSSLRETLAGALAGARAPYRPGHWLEEQDWNRVGPRLLPGLR